MCIPQHAAGVPLTIIRVGAWAAVVFVGARALQVILQLHLHLPQLGPPAHVLNLRYLEQERANEPEDHQRQSISQCLNKC